MVSSGAGRVVCKLDAYLGGLIAKSVQIKSVLLLVRGRTGWTDYVTRPSRTGSVQRCRTDRLGSGRTGSTGLGLVGLVVLALSG